MLLPEHIKLTRVPNTQTMNVVIYGVEVGSYAHKHSGGGCRWRALNGAWGDCATEHAAVVAIVEVAYAAMKLQTSK